jgi:5'-nucleotidase
MPVDLSNILVVGISSRSLFSLEHENEIFNSAGVTAFRKHQAENENVILDPGPSFQLIKKLLDLNKISSQQVVEIVVMSSNSPQTGMRIMNSIKAHNLDITRMAFTGGQPISSYLPGYGVDLFLSRDEDDVQKVIDSKLAAAAIILNAPEKITNNPNVVKFGFDADEVLFTSSEYRYQTEGLDAFLKHEKENENVPLPEGPFAKFLLKLSHIQQYLPGPEELSPLKAAIITARSGDAIQRVINTLKEWGVYIHEIHFLGGLSKDKILEAAAVDFFCDDSEAHLVPASKKVPTGKVPYATGSEMKNLKK